ncbi:MAG: IS701 family transposase [Planctomycetota bacterium]
MSLPIIETPSQLKKYLNGYRGIFTKPQFNHFSNLITGTIVSDNKTIQEINDCFAEKDQSNLNRFVTSSDWDAEEVNDIRISQAKKMPLKKGIIILDPSMLHKTGKHMEKVNYHYSGTTKKKELGHLLVNCFFTDGKHRFPVKSDFYLRDEDADKEHPFKTSREICMEQLDYSVSKKIPFWLVMADAGLYSDFMIKKIKSLKKKYVIGIRITNKFTINNREKRINASDYFDTITDLDFNTHIIGGEVYHLHTKEIYTRGIGKERLLISYKDGDEDVIKIYTTNVLDKSDEEMMEILLERWEIETLHRDAKQHLGLEDYQLRKFGGIQKVVLAVLVAYTLLALCLHQKILEPLGRAIKTIGEGCRFFRLIAIKGWRWIKRKARNINRLKWAMNNFVFVKNAKV